MLSAIGSSLSSQTVFLLIRVLIRYRLLLLDILLKLLERAPILRLLPGMYEVLDFDASLELMNTNGSLAVYSKKQRVRFLQNNIIAYQDTAWGDGKIFANYDCAPGIPVDRYREGHRYNVLISLRESKSRGDVENFHIVREIKDGFTQRVEEFQAEIDHRTRELRLQVIFPKRRLPQKVILIQQKLQQSINLGAENSMEFPDGRVAFFWEAQSPRLFEAYIIRWYW